MGADLVRVCPTCGTRNPPDKLRCDCGALLFGVDLVRPEDLQAPVTEPAVAPAATPTAEAPPQAAPVRCPYADCGQRNPPGGTRCLYCNRLLSADAPAPAPADALGHDGAADPGLAATDLLQLPTALRTRFRVLRALDARGAEADILLVARVDDRAPEAAGDPGPWVVKLYRQGILPSAEVQARIAAVDPRHRVNLLETGLSDGRAYELMEFCAPGSLRQHLVDGQSASPDFITDVVRELAAALQAVHTAALVHRDLKPENVLVRRERPLDLVLTDFSTASVMDATLRFTGMARTLLYAAPEALSGVLDAKADYWALGMLVLEMATGAHPFRGLSEAVILHQLTTRAVSVSEVADARLRLLLRGLLLRDPDRRWGDAELARWLAGDTSLPEPVDDAALAGGFSQPYAVLDERCHTPEQLAVAFARHWGAGLADLANGQLLRWFTEVQKDQNAVRLLLDLRYETQLSPDQQLLRFILHYAPGIPPLWRGRSVEVGALLTAASEALRHDAAAGEWLAELHERRVLEAYAAAGNSQSAELVQRWNGALADFDAAWADFGQRLKRHDQPVQAEVALFDDLVYGSGPTPALARPVAAKLHPRLLAAAYAPAWVERLRARVLRDWVPLAVACPWLNELGDPQHMGAAQLLAAEGVLPEARRLADQQVHNADLRQRRQADESGALGDALQAATAQVATAARRVMAPFADTDALRAALDAHAELMARVRAHPATDEAWQATRRRALRNEATVHRLRDACDVLDEHVAVNEGWISREVGWAVLVAFWLATFFWRTVGGVLVVVLAGGLLAWRAWPLFRLTGEIHRLGRELQGRRGGR